MPRAARIYTEEGLFHILTRGNNKQQVFQDEVDFRAYKKILKQLKTEQPDERQLLFPFNDNYF